MQLFLSKRTAAQLILFAAGIAMTVFGVWRGEADTVLYKAINLCLECVGIG
nr:CD1871A family CXXC motif-containing protein [Agathobaculum sp. Marseille-P7918]